MLKPAEYWHEKYDLLQGLDNKLQSVVDFLILKYPDDYIEATKEMIKHG